MKYVKAGMATYDAAVGRIEPGETYFVEDDKAERWINAGIATTTRKPPEPEPEAAPEDEEDDEDVPPEKGETPELGDRVKQMAEEGKTQQAIADELNLSRGQVRRLLAS